MTLQTTSIYAPETFAPQDDLLERRNALSFMTDIPDMETYALDWAKLAADFRGCGLDNNAAYCQARADYYGTLPAGGYVRVFDGSTSEITSALVYWWEWAHGSRYACETCARSER